MMLRQVADGVQVHASEFMQTNTVVVSGGAGVLLVDPGVLGRELAGIAEDLHEQGEPVVAGFSTHPHWDHLLWHPGFGAAARYGTAACASVIQARMADPGWKAFVAGMIPDDIVEQVPLDDVFGRISGLPAATTRIPWDGPDVRILEHRAHAPGHAALLIEDRGVLVAGDMLSDLLIPMLNPFAEEPVEDYLAALLLLEEAAADADVLVPGHGSVGDADELHARIDRDRAYLDALRDAREPVDPRLGPSAALGAEMTRVHTGQLQRLAQARESRASGRS